MLKIEFNLIYFIIQSVKIDSFCKNLSIFKVKKIIICEVKSLEFLIIKIKKILTFFSRG